MHNNITASDKMRHSVYAVIIDSNTQVKWKCIFHC